MEVIIILDNRGIRRINSNILRILKIYENSNRICVNMCVFVIFIAFFEIFLGVNNTQVFDFKIHKTGKNFD